MNENRNTILAIVLSMLVLIGWQLLFPVTGPAPQQQPQQTSSDATGQPAPAAEAPGTAAPAAPKASREEAVAGSPRVPIDTPSIIGSINLVGGRIDDVRLKKFHETIDEDSPLIVLFSPSGAPDAYYADYGWVAGEGVAVPGPDTVWTAPEGAKLTPATPVVLEWNNGNGLIFRKAISVDDRYMFTVRLSVENTASTSAQVYPYGLVSRHGTPPSVGTYILHEGPIGVFGEDGLSEISYKTLRSDKTIDHKGAEKGWLGFTDKYWAAALIPPAGQPFEGRFTWIDRDGTDIYQADFLGPGETVQPGASSEVVSHLFAGAKEVSVINAYNEALSLERFDLMIDWGWFYFLTKPMFFVIDWLYRFVGNFGVAILLVTVAVKLLFFPLANKSYASMSRMKKVQPQVKALQERFKDDRMAMQQAMMELYRKEKINPLAGCLPILIQIPVFFSLYKVLYTTIEMRHAPFFGWIQDLSAPDPTTVFNLFGLIPWNPPSVLMLGVWPLLMGITMFIQMRLNPTPPDPTQRIIFNWMPVIFTFMLAQFPAGLVIYWTWNNTLSILQQTVIMRRNGVKIELWDNIKSAFNRSGAGAKG